MDETITDRSGPPPGGHRPNVCHVYVRHDNRTYFLAPDGTFVLELKKGRAFQDIQDAFDVVNRMVEGRDLSRKDQPGVMVNAWKWIGMETATSD